MLRLPKRHVVLIVLTENKVFYFSKKLLYAGAIQNKLALTGPHIEMKMVNCQFRQSHQKLSRKILLEAIVRKLLPLKKIYLLQKQYLALSCNYG